MNIDPSTKPLALTYPFLKQQGIAYIQQLAGKIWTDYSEHDPGITILEELCYAIVDLEYRTNFYIEDLLAPNPYVPQEDTIKDFYYAEEILPCNPLTVNDFLKLAVDTAGVRNAKILLSQEPQAIKGGYRVLLDLEAYVLQHRQEEKIKQEVKKKLYQHRNLCEDFFEVGLLKPLAIRINAAFEIKLAINHKEGDLLIAEILANIQSFIAPRIHFYSLKRMILNKGKSVEQLFTGPLLQHGFIDDEELAQSIRTKICVSDILERATEIPGVESILNFSVAVDTKEGLSSTMIIDVPPDRVFKVDVQQCAITIYHNGFPVQVNIHKVQHYFEEITLRGTLKKAYLTDEKVALQKGRFRNLADYTSIQHDFPLIYSVGTEGLSHSADKESKAKANQLKGYFMFFDQLLKNYCVQLAYVKDLMAVQHEEHKNVHSQIPEDVPYLERLLKIPGAYGKKDLDTDFKVQRKYLDIIVKASKNSPRTDQSFIKEAYLNYLDKIVEVKRLYPKKRSAMLDHLLARFAEVFTTYSLLLYEDFEEQGLQAFRYDKALFLQDYIAISRDKNKGMDLTDTSHYGWDSDNIAGFERRLYRKLGIKNLRKRFLYEILTHNFYLEKTFKKHSLELFLGKNLQSKYDNILIFKGKFPQIRNLAIRYGIKEANYDIIKKEEANYALILYVDKKRNKYLQLVNEQIALKSVEQAEKIIQQAVRFFNTFNRQSEGFHLVEHILLRSSNTFQGTDDPYSFIMTLVFPAWPARFQKKAFRRLIHELIMLESPAHVFVNVLWLDLEEMEAFEKAYKRWLHLKTTLEANDPRLKQAAKNLLGLIMLYARDEV